MSFNGSECMLVLDGSLSVDSVVALESQFDQLVSSEVDHVVLDIDALQALDGAGVDALARLGELMDGRHAVVSLRSERWAQDACSPVS
jgi:ABC-type transporter Mla MlaB component